MYDENKWNEMNNENEKKDGGEPVNAQNAQNAQQPQNRPQDAQQSQGQSEHTGRQIYGRLGGAQSGQPYNGNAQNQNQNGSYYGGQQHQQQAQQRTDAFPHQRLHGFARSKVFHFSQSFSAPDGRSLSSFPYRRF